MKHLLLFLLLPVCGFSQITVLDSITKAPIKYAVVEYFSDNNISVNDYANESGIFYLKTDQKYTNLVISCLGFEKKKFVYEKLPKEIVLNAKNIAIEEVNISTKTTRLNEFDKNNDGGYAMALNHQQVGVIINNPCNTPKTVKNIIMHISNRNKKAFVFRIHLYKVNSSQKPLEEIEILNNSFTINNKDKGIIKINVQDNQIELPLGQVLLTVELITMQSKSCINIQSSSYLGNNDYSFLRIANRPWNDLTDILTYRSKAPVKQNLKIGVDIFD